MTTFSDLNFTTKEEADLVTKQFHTAYVIFVTSACHKGIPHVCKLHDVFGTADSDHHNCIGCNLADAVEQILCFLEASEYQRRIQYSYTTFLILCYLLVERLDTVFNLVQLNEDYRKENFKILLAVRRWANFIKHPKAFLLTHHAEFTFIGSPKNGELTKNASVVIDRKFLDRFYSNDENNTELFKTLENKERVLVIFPEVSNISEELCKAMCDTVELFKDNAVYRNVLTKRSTFLDYWINSESGS